MKYGAKLGTPGHMPSAEVTPGFNCGLITCFFAAVHFSQKIKFNRDVILWFEKFRILVQAVLSEDFPHLKQRFPIEGGFTINIE